MANLPGATDEERTAEVTWARNQRAVKQRHEQYATDPYKGPLHSGLAALTVVEQGRLNEHLAAFESCNEV